MKTREQMLKERARQIMPELEKAGEIARKAAAANRAMTADEREKYDAAMAVAEPVLAGLKDLRRDEAITAAARELTAGIGAPAGTGGITGTKTGQRLSFKGMAGGVAARMLGGPELGTKALAPSGAAVVPQAFVADPVALGRAATGLLDVLPVRVQPSSEYSFIRQTTRTNNAAVVAEGATKPTSVLGLTRVEQSLAVIAHLSEGVPRYWLVDNASLEAFIDAELEYGLRVAVEAKVVSDVNGTSGIQTQAFSTSIVQTVRKALTKIEVAGYTPSAIVLHPSDFETVELAIASSSAIEYQGLPYDAARRVLFGVPIATTVSATVGTGHVLAADAVVLDVDQEGVALTWSETSNDTDWASNLTRARSELRAQTSVLAPLGVVKATLAASGGASGSSGASGS